jgi:hypothetical protein
VFSGLVHTMENIEDFRFLHVVFDSRLDVILPKIPFIHKFNIEHQRRRKIKHFYSR